MMKTTYALLLAAVCSYGTLPGQTMASWNLTNNGVPSVLNSNIQASFLQDGAGITKPTFAPDGAASIAWETTPMSSAEDYFEICVNPKPGYTLLVNGLSYTESRSSDGIRAYDLKWSKDGFVSSNLLLSVNVPDDENARTNNLGSLGISVCQGETICFRWYGYQAESNFGQWRLADISLAGDAPQLCNPHTNPAFALSTSNVTNNAMQVSWNRGNGDGVVVIARAGAAPQVSNCDWQISSASPVFGLGTNLGNDSYVVYDGTGVNFTLLGLMEGVTYHLAAYEYSGFGYCMNTNALVPRTSATTACTQPAAASKLQWTPSDQSIYLSWALPACYDEVMVVASTQAIASLPSSPNPGDYLADANYGSGIDNSGDFSASESPVYRGSGSRIKVTGLVNGQTYHFRIFTFRNGQWVGGPQVSAQPDAGCPELGGGGLVFLNEIHYQNEMEDVDEGVEIMGPAGTDLAKYTLASYRADRFMDQLIRLEGTIPDQGEGYGAVWVPIPGLFEIAAVAFYNLVADTTIEFLVWRDITFQARDGLAQNLIATNIGVREDPATPLNYSLQRVGPGNCPSGMTWQGPMPSSRGLINTGQALLPIQLSHFEGRLIGDRVRLNWATISEEDNDYMAVEHSMDGRSFREIGRVKGAGTTTLPQDYELWHDYPLPGINYYRLKQVDFDGQFEYFSAIAIEYRPGQVVFKVYPTLAAERLTVELSTPRQTPGELVLFNLLGQPLQRIAVPEGGLRRELSVAALAPGHYLIHWQPQGGEQLVQRFVKQ